jgi:hypothetical protein
MTVTRRLARTGCAAAAIVLAPGCGNYEPVGNPGSITLAVSPATLSVSQGGSGSMNATLTRGGGFSGVATLAIAGLPAGITTTIDPAQLSSTTTSATVNVAVAPTVAPGNYAATVTATAQGLTPATATYTVAVTTPPGFTMSVAPTALAVAPGASGTADVTIVRTNFTQGVSLALANPPAGITGAFTPTPTTTNASSLVVSVAAGVAPGPYALTIRGTATGLTDRVASLQLTVTPPSSGSRDVVYRFCDPAGTPVFFGYQDGGGSWRALGGTTSGDETRFAFTLTQGHGGVLLVFAADAALQDRRLAALGAGWERAGIAARSGMAAAGGRAAAAGRLGRVGYHETYVTYASAAQLQQDGASTCFPPVATKTVRTTVAGVGTGEYGVVSLGDATELFVGGTSPNPVTFGDVPAGPLLFLATRIRAPGSPPDKLLLFRNVDVPDGGTLPAIDFNAAGAVAPASATATIANGGSDPLEIYTVLHTANGDALMWFDLAPSTVAARPWAGLAPASMTGGDFHGLVVFATPVGGGTGNFRLALRYVGQVTNQSLSLGPPITAPTVTQVTAGAYPRLRFQGTLPAEYGNGAFIDVVSSAEGSNVFGIVLTGAWLAASGNAFGYDLTMPDVAGLAGFPASARLTGGTNQVLFSPFGFTGSGIFGLEPAVGGEFRSGTRAITVAVP